MRLKTYTAASTNEALDMVRVELGDGAIVVSSQPSEDGRSARVVAAIEDLPLHIDEESESGIEESASDPLDVAESVRQALHFHGTPAGLLDRLARTAYALDAANPTLAFAGAMDARFRFMPLSDESIKKPVMLVGPPGVGKTVTIAKLSARSIMSGKTIGVISTDTARAGAMEQLSAFTNILKVELRSAPTIADLRRTVDSLSDRQQIFIDTAGANPYSDADMEHLLELVNAAGAEPVLVLAAGGDAMEAAESANAFALIGAKRLIVTRIDLSRRLGAILAAGDAGNLAFSDVSVTPHVADGLTPINPVSLARLIMPHTMYKMPQESSHPTPEVDP